MGLEGIHTGERTPLSRDPAQGGERPHGGDPALSYVPRTFYERTGKRIFDLAVGLFALVLLSPLLLLIVIAIRLDSPGRILYVSTRLGRRAQPFRFLKFRSMFVGADLMKSQLAHLNEMDGPVFKISNDPRVTRMGRFLRKTSLDELPQLFSVIRGDMSLVGPRPPIPVEVEEYELWQRRRLAVTPGITCLWQVSGRNQIGFSEWMRLDMAYIDHLSFALDLRIMLLTVPAVIRGSRGGAS